MDSSAAGERGQGEAPKKTINVFRRTAAEGPARIAAAGQEVDELYDYMGSGLSSCVTSHRSKSL